MKTLEDSKGNVPAQKHMKIEIAKEGRRLLLLESEITTRDQRMLSILEIR